jgi:hypothetical protein
MVMRKLLIIVTLALAVGAAAPAASAWASPGHDQATGTGTLGQFGDPTAHVNAIKTPAGLKGGFTITWFPGSYIVIGVQDNGEPGTAGPDQLNFSPGFATDPGCGPNAAAAPVFPIVTGNYRVFSAH